MNYSTKLKAGKVLPMVDRLATITCKEYVRALDMMQGNERVGLLPICGEWIWEEGHPYDAPVKKMVDSQREYDYNLPIIWAIYSILQKEYEKKFFQHINNSNENRSNESWEKHWEKTPVSIYFPEFARMIGKKGNLRAGENVRYMEELQKYEHVIGIIVGHAYQVLRGVSLDCETNTIKFYAPYLKKLIYEVHMSGVKKAKDGKRQVRKNGEYKLHPTHSYLIHSSIVSERNRKAIEIVRIVTILIEQAGSGNPHITPQHIIERTSFFREALNKMQRDSRAKDLTRAFGRAWELLAKKTDLRDVYREIRLPSKSCLPTLATLDVALEFPHKGKGKK